MQQDSQISIKLGSIFAALGVIAGAFGAHALKSHLSTELLTIYETASRYQLIHALALLILGILRINTDNKLYSYSSLLFTVGIIIFSGSLYALSLSGIKIFGAITPIGGLCFILGWLFLFFGTQKRQNKP